MRYIRRILRASSAILVVLLIGLSFCLQSFFSQSAVAAPARAKTCIPAYSADTFCYARSQLLSPHKPTAIAVNPWGKILAAGDDKNIQVWNLRTGSPMQRLKAHSNLITALAISPDEQMLASSSLDRTIRLWNLQTGDLVGTLNAGRASALAFSPDGRFLASGSRVRHWADGAYSPSGVQFWDLATQQRLYVLGNEPIRRIAFSPDGQLLAAGGSKTYVWQLKDGESLYTLNSGELTGLAFSQDGQFLLSGSSKVKLWDLTNGKLIHDFGAGASDLALSSDGQTLATAAGQTIHFWQVQSEEFLGLLRASPYSGGFVKLALDGEAVVSGSSDGIRIWRSIQPE